MAKKQQQPREVVDEDTAVALRPVIREVMRMAPGRKWPVATLAAKLRALHEVNEATVKAALAWNQAKGYCDFHYHAEFEREEWFLTDRGEALAT